jgi:hypothetical protein
MEGEPTLQYQNMIIIDGNNSQKRSIHAKTDRRRFQSDYFIPDSDVDRFSKQVNRAITPDLNGDDDEDDNEIVSDTLVPLSFHRHCTDAL